MAKITTELLIKRALSDNDKFKVRVFHSDILDGDIEIRKVDVVRILDILDHSGDSFTDNFNANCAVIYECCPLFHNDELIHAYECVEPYEVVKHVFEHDLNEIIGISSIIMDMYGLKEGTITSYVKN